MSTYLPDLLQRMAGTSDAVTTDCVAIDDDVVVSLHEDEASAFVWAYASPGYIEAGRGAGWGDEPWSAQPQDDPSVGGGVRMLHVEPSSGLVLLAHGWPRSALDVITLKDGLIHFAKVFRLWSEMLWSTSR